MAKMPTIKKALELDLQLNLRKVVFYSNSKLIIDSITNTQSSAPWVIYAPLQKIEVKKDHLGVARFMAITKSLNYLAHN